MREYQNLMAVVLFAKQQSLSLYTSNDFIWFECQRSEWHVIKILVRILVKNADNEPLVLMMNIVHEII